LPSTTRAYTKLESRQALLLIFSKIELIWFPEQKDPARPRFFGSSPNSLNPLCLKLGSFFSQESKLLEIRCSTIEQMRMVNALCRFVDEAVGS